MRGRAEEGREGRGRAEEGREGTEGQRKGGKVRVKSLNHAFAFVMFIYIMDASANAAEIKSFI